MNDAFREAAAGSLKGILDATDEELVSSDFNGNAHSSIVDLPVDRGRRRQPGQGAGLVRQRVGLFCTRARPDPVHRQVAVSPVRVKLSIEQVELAGRRVVPTRRPQRAARGGRGRRRHAADRRGPHHPPRCSSAGASVVLASHLGRPKGGPDPKYSLAPVATRLSALLSRPVPLAPDCVGAETEALAHALEAGRDPTARRTCASTPRRKATTTTSRAGWPRWPTCYVNDAFAAAHRAHASIAAIITRHRAAPPRAC